MVSPRPSCMSWLVSRMVSPPSWRTATSNETRVRVEGLSKIIASTRPASGLLAEDLAARALRPRFFMARLVSIIPRSSRGGMLDRRGGPVDARHGVRDLRLLDDERRQQPHDVVAGRYREELFGAQR